MIKHLLTAASAALLVAACSPSTDTDAAGEGSAPSAPASRGIVKTKVSKSDGKLPSEIRITSSVGEVVFLHETHFKDRGINCAECHHQINARKLNTPHPDYLASSWINCTTCHKELGTVDQKAYTCSGCHHTNPIHIADETLSAKVVTHKQCWKCHAVGTAQDASKSCGLCHSGKKSVGSLALVNSGGVRMDRR